MSYVKFPICEGKKGKYLFGISGYNFSLLVPFNHKMDPLKAFKAPSNSKFSFGQKGRRVHPQVREIISNVIKFMKKEAVQFKCKQEPLIPLVNFRERAMAATGASKKLYESIMDAIQPKVPVGGIPAVITPNPNQQVKVATGAPKRVHQIIGNGSVAANKMPIGLPVIITPTNYDQLIINWNVKKQQLSTVKHQCKHCEFTTDNAVVLQQHVQYHEFKCEESSEKLKCRHCGFITDAADILQQHIEYYHKFSCVQTSPEELKCKQCDFTTNLTVVMQEHYQQLKKLKKTTIRIYLCESCSFQTHFVLKWFKHVTNDCAKRKNPIPIHKKPPNYYQCNKCDCIAKYNDLLYHKTVKYTGQSLHLLECDNSKHSNNNKCSWYKCPKCIYGSKSFTMLKTHMMKHLSNAKIYWFCDKCNFAGKSEAGLDRHNREKHKNVRKLQQKTKM